MSLRQRAKKAYEAYRSDSDPPWEELELEECTRWHDVVRAVQKRIITETGLRLMLMGYWAPGEERGPKLPNVEDWVVPHMWEPGVRKKVVQCLKSGLHLVSYCGWSSCRICGKHNGDSELTDGVLYWPDGLVHYVEEHGVVLPSFFTGIILEGKEPFLPPKHPNPELAKYGTRLYVVDEDPWLKFGSDPPCKEAWSENIWGNG